MRAGPGPQDIGVLRSSERVYEILDEAIAEQRCVVLDGGVATELPHRHGQDEERVWGVEALASSPTAVLDVHRRYVAAGVDLLTTNTWGLPTAVAGAQPIVDEQQRPLQWLEVARRGVRIARQAIAEAGREDSCAVGLSLNGDLEVADGIETVSLLHRALSADPPDLIVLETLSVIRPSLLAIVQALVDTGLPVWLSFRRCRHGLCGVYGQHWGGPEGDAFGRTARRLGETGIAALLINCIPPDHVDGMISYLRDFTDLPLGVYPNLGYHTNDGWQSKTEIGGSEYAELALRWRAEGAQIIGGCCGTRPEHIAAARDALAGTRPGVERRPPPGPRPAPSARESQHEWTDRRGRSLYPFPFPTIARHAGVPGPIVGTGMTWRYLLQESVGAHQRCLEIGCGTGLQTVQLALNGADHVHALDVDERAVANALANAFRNGVSEQVSGEVVDLYPWLPSERYEVIVANLPQVPLDPATEVLSHRPVDYWGRGLVDQVLSKLPRALAEEGVAFITLTSIISRERTMALLDDHELSAHVVAWELTSAPTSERWNEAHVSQVEALSDAFRVSVGDEPQLVAYLLAIRHRDDRDQEAVAPWARGPGEL